MSADNGYILRRNQAGKFVLQMYFASNESYPPINQKGAMHFLTVDSALAKYEELARSNIVEYGLTVDTKHITYPKKGNTNMLETQKYVRKPFEVEAVQVTAQNMSLVALWCDGQIKLDGKKEYISVADPKPHSPRHTKAFVGDWVVYAGRGHKVYLSKPFERSFDAVGVTVIHPEVALTDPAQERLVELLVTDEPAKAPDVVTTVVPSEVSPVRVSPAMMPQKRPVVAG